MARSEARISVDIWTNDGDWAALSRDAQWTYWMLLSQPDLPHDGVLMLRVRRWADVTGTPITDLRRFLGELATKGFIVVDADKEELFVRSLMRRDQVYRQPNVLRAASKHLPLVASPTIRRALIAELQRIQGLSDVPAGSVEVLADMIAYLSETGSSNPSPDPITEGFDEEDRPNGPDFDDRVSLEDVSAGHNPQPNPSTEPFAQPSHARAQRVPLSPFPLPPSPFPPPLSASRALSRRQPPNSTPVPTVDTAQTLIGEWIDHVPKKPPGTVISRVGKHLKAMLAEGISTIDLRRGLAAWAQRGLDPSVLPSIVNEVMNAPADRGRTPKQSTTDQRVTQARAAGARIQAQLDQGAISA